MYTPHPQLIEDEVGLDSTLAAQLNSPTVRGSTHVIKLWSDGLLEEEVAAILRHELEHVRQFQADPSILNLYLRSCELLEGLSDSGRMYQSIPIERDANEAAGVFVRRLYGHERIASLVDQGLPGAAAMRPSHRTEQQQSLRDRMVQFTERLEHHHYVRGRTTERVRPAIRSDWSQDSGADPASS